MARVVSTVRQNWLKKKIAKLGGRDWLLILASVPIIALLLTTPHSFESIWIGENNQVGLGGLLFALFFLGFDLLYFHKRKLRWTNRRRILSLATVSVATASFLELNFSAVVTGFVYWVGRQVGVSCGPQVLPIRCDSVSFLTGLDYLAMSLYIAVLASALFHFGVLRRIPTLFVFSVGMFVFYMLDAFFPYGQLGPLQFWANYDVESVTRLSGMLSLPIYGSGNIITMASVTGLVCHLTVFWPSVGIQSILVFSVVIVSVFYGPAKLEIPRNRKMVYIVMGASGTVVLNFLRMFAIAYYGYAYATSCVGVKSFHDIIGNILYPVWIVGFLAVIMKIEDQFK